MTKHKILIVLILLVGIFIRFYRLPELTSFSYEQALALEASGSMIKTGKISLIGVEYFIRKTQDQHSFFNNAFYLYPFSVIQKTIGYDPIYPAILYSLLNIFGGIYLYLLVKKYLGQSASTVLAGLYSFSPLMVDISRSFWHVNLLVPVTIFSLWALSLIYESKKIIYPILFGILIGLGASIHISFLIGAALLFLTSAIILFRKQRTLHILFIIFGAAIGNITTIVFDLRHSFYNTKTFATFVYETFAKNNNDFNFEYYHFLYFIIPIFILAAFLIAKIKNNLIIATILSLYIAGSFPLLGMENTYPKGMPKGTSLQIIKSIGKIISSDASGQFEVASIIDGETRAENLRYILEYVYNKPAMGIEKYPEANTLYVTESIDQNPLEKSVWELDSLKPSKITKEWPVNDQIKLVKLERTINTDSRIGK